MGVMGMFRGANAVGIPRKGNNPSLSTQDNNSQVHRDTWMGKEKELIARMVMQYSTIRGKGIGERDGSLGGKPASQILLNQRELKSEMD